MNLARLTLRRIAGSPFRSALVFLCVAFVTGATVWSHFTIRAAEEKLSLSVSAMENPGVDFLVVPRGSGYSSTGMGNVNLPGLMSDVAAIPGVEHVSPQLLLSTILGSEYCSKPEMFLVVFDPATDFTIQSRLERPLGSKISQGEALVGSLVAVPGGGDGLTVAGADLRLVGHMSPTGTKMDQSVYITFDTYQEMIGQGSSLENIHPEIEVKNAPYILVKVEAGNSPQRVGGWVLKNIRGVSIFDNKVFFNMAQSKMANLLGNIPWLLRAGWALTILWVGMIFFIAVNERRREIGVLRALGSPRLFIFRSLFAEGFVLAVSAVVVGTGLGVLAVVLMQNGFSQSLGLLQASLSPLTLLHLFLESLGLALFCVFLAAVVPAWRISRQDPALVMRG